MAKFYGSIGFVETRESVFGSGCFDEEVVVERNYRGDEIRATRKWESAEQLNDNININVSISIISDDYADRNLGCIRYAYWRGNYWKVTSVDIQRPRLVLSLGGVYNGPTKRS